MARLLLSLIVGAVITFFLYVLMAFLVGGDDKFTNAKKEQIVIEINSTPPEAKANTRVRQPPPPPPPPPEPPKNQVQAEPDTADAAAMGFAPPQIDLGADKAGLDAPEAMGSRDGDVQPIVRMDPKYPVQAARDGINGYVKFRVTVLEDGTVGDVEIIEAEPKRVFDREVIRAVKRWKYQPKIENGKPVKQTVTTQLDFNLDESGG